MRRLWSDLGPIKTTNCCYQFSTTCGLPFPHSKVFSYIIWYNSALSKQLITPPKSFYVTKESLKIMIDRMFLPFFISWIYALARCLVFMASKSSAAAQSGRAKTAPCDLPASLDHLLSSSLGHHQQILTQYSSASHLKVLSHESFVLIIVPFQSLRSKIGEKREEYGLLSDLGHMRRRRTD